ncbi:YdiK family protein [uncultured Metabacillus sp.]|uniref:YdiK family protein n=1 Tax=Metabacillus sp. Hm71 TaxID=3450743 RepID=UPI002610A012|nr:YdiK family protein [uncultured Metabacillus sp.]
MRTNPISMGIFYLTMGLLFTYLAISSAENGIFSFPTILLMLIATFDIGVAIRMFIFTSKMKKMSKKK